MWCSGLTSDRTLDFEIVELCVVKCSVLGCNVVLRVYGVRGVVWDISCLLYAHN